jgi:hypothetical protein
LGEENRSFSSSRDENTPLKFESSLQTYKKYLSFTAIVAQPTYIIRMQCSKCRLCSASWGWASNARNM